jgi:hypothetical protein
MEFKNRTKVQSVWTGDWSANHARESFWKYVLIGIEPELGKIISVRPF